jgi:hypothetical protein
MAVYKHAVNAGDHCGLQARIIDLQNTHKKMRLRILSSLSRSQLTLKPSAHNRVSCGGKQLRNTGSQLHMYMKTAAVNKMYMYSSVHKWIIESIKAYQERENPITNLN